MACQNKLTRYHLYEGVFPVLRIFPFFVAQYLPRKALLNHHHLHLHQRRPFLSCAGAEVFGIAVFTKSHAPLRWNVIQSTIQSLFLLFVIIYIFSISSFFQSLLQRFLFSTFTCYHSIILHAILLFSNCNVSLYVRPCWRRKAVPSEILVKR